MSDVILVLPPVHFCDWSSQPSIRIFCTQNCGTPSWYKSFVPDLYFLDTGEKYTFNEDKVTCKNCLDKLKEG